MKLNLGCGVFPFPLDRENVPNPAHLLPLPDTVYEPGWVNVDKHTIAGAQERIDLFRFPWVRSSNGSPFNTSSVDYIWAAHILEHVPHQVRTAQDLPGAMARDYATYVQDLDGFFVFMTECWRILKPNGLMHIRCPYATSYPALSDPTHTRYMTPGAFGYLGAGDEHRPFDYHIPCRFELHEPITFRFSPHWQQRAKDYSSEGFQNLLYDHYSAADEFKLTLRAVKDSD
jgi:hypothetical protein